MARTHASAREGITPDSRRGGGPYPRVQTVASASRRLVAGFHRKRVYGRPSKGAIIVDVIRPTGDRNPQERTASASAPAAPKPNRSSSGLTEGFAAETENARERCCCAGDLLFLRHALMTMHANGAAATAGKPGFLLGREEVVPPWD